LTRHDAFPRAYPPARDAAHKKTARMLNAPTGCLSKHAVVMLSIDVLVALAAKKILSRRNGEENNKETIP
jgi:hypothetical protein